MKSKLDRILLAVVGAVFIALIVAFLYPFAQTAVCGPFALPPQNTPWLCERLFVHDPGY